MKLRNNLFFLLMIFFSFLRLSQVYGEAKKTPTIQWLTNFEEATLLAQKSNQPIVLFFTGSDWCGWCNRLEKEVFENQEFVAATTNKLIFVKLDYPMKKTQNAEIAKQNEALQKRFSIKGYPTVILLDPEEQPIGVTGYRAGGGKQYAMHLMKMLNEFTAYKEQIKALGSHKFSGKELKRLYQQASEFGFKNDQGLLIKIGASSDLASFFLVERYRFLANKGQGESEEALSIKQQLDTLDNNDDFLTHYQIAMIDFEINTKDAAAQSLSNEAIAKPLISYIDRFGKQKTEYAWRLSMVICQIYLDQNDLENALKYAKQSYETAPATVQTELAIAIKNIQEQLTPAD